LPGKELRPDQALEGGPIADVDAAAFELDDALGAERFQGATDNLAARAGHGGQQFVCEPGRGGGFAVGAFEQDLGDAAGDVAERQVLDELERLTQSAGEVAGDGQADAWALAHEAQQVATAQEEQGAILDGLGAGGVIADVEDGDLVRKATDALKELTLGWM
jgi:hypothetical protein